eukprot:GEMP01011648.1.p1 GENE.GEMP01011648.1~~GEMP01011648.1.p1  ORF type:complete len:662 (+),score=186.49 GEMP01011648.1:135-2120(+)
MATYVVSCRHLWNQTIAEAHSCLGNKGESAGYIQSMENRLMKFGYLHPPSSLIDPQKGGGHEDDSTSKKKGKRKRKKHIDYYDPEDAFLDDTEQWDVSKNQQEFFDEMVKKHRGFRKKVLVVRQDTDYIVTTPNVRVESRSFRSELALHRRMEGSQSMRALVEQVGNLDSRAFRRMLGEELRKGWWRRRPISRIAHSINFTAGGLLICQGIEQELKEWYIAQANKSVDGWEAEAAEERRVLLDRLPKPLTCEQMWAFVAENMVMAPAQKQNLKKLGWAPPTTMRECTCRYDSDARSDVALQVIDRWIREREEERGEQHRMKLFENMVQVYDSDEEPDPPPIKDGAPTEENASVPIANSTTPALAGDGDVPAPIANSNPAAAGDIACPAETTNTAIVVYDENDAHASNRPMSNTNNNAAKPAVVDAIGDAAVRIEDTRSAAIVEWDPAATQAMYDEIEAREAVTFASRDEYAAAVVAAAPPEMTDSEDDRPLVPLPPVSPATPPPSIRITAVVLTTPVQDHVVDKVLVPCALFRPPKPPTFVNESFLLNTLLRTFAKSMTNIILQTAFSLLVRKLFRKRRQQKRFRDIVEVRESSEDELIMVSEKNTPAGLYEGDARDEYGDARGDAWAAARGFVLRDSSETWKAQETGQKGEERRFIVCPI